MKSDKEDELLNTAMKGTVKKIPPVSGSMRKEIGRKRGGKIVQHDMWRSDQEEGVTSLSACWNERFWSLLIEMMNQGRSDSDYSGLWPVVSVCWTTVDFRIGTSFESHVS